MISLFAQEETFLTDEIALARARALLISYLNKGIIPSWETFQKDLSISITESTLILIKQKFELLVLWPHLRLILQHEGTEYFLHGTTTSQWAAHDGNKYPLHLEIEQDDWQLWLEILSIHFKQNWNVENPFVSFYGELFGEKYRLSMVHQSTSPTGNSKLILRSIASKPFPLNVFGETSLIHELSLKKANMLIAGSTGSGKTSLLSALLQEITSDEHLVILEDTFEIQSKHIYTTRFLAGESPQTSLKSYLAYSLRLSPDRIILGEIRSHEVVPLLMAMNTGHKGVMSTIHASSAHDALHRVALLFSLYASEANLSFEKVMELLCRNIEYVVFMEKKKIKEVIKILGSDKGHAFFETITT